MYQTAAQRVVDDAHKDNDLSAILVAEGESDYYCGNEHDKVYDSRPNADGLEHSFNLAHGAHEGNMVDAAQ